MTLTCEDCRCIICMYAWPNVWSWMYVKAEYMRVSTAHVGYVLSECINVLSAMPADLQPFWTVPSGVPCTHDNLTLITLAMPSVSESGGLPLIINDCIVTCQMCVTMAGVRLMEIWFPEIKVINWNDQDLSC